MNRICLIYNFAQHYREGVFSLLNSKLHIDFFFGSSMDGVRKLDYSLLTNFKKEFKNVFIFKPIYWQNGVISTFFKNEKVYNRYIVLGEYFCISTWVLLFLIKLYPKKKIFLWSHGWYGNESIIKRVVKRFFFNLSDGVFLYGEYAKGLMIKEKIPSNKLFVIYNSLNFEYQSRIFLESKESQIFKKYFNNDNDVIIFSGRLIYSKKINQLIEAISLLLNKGVNLNLVIVGDGPMKGELYNLLRVKGIQDFWFFGECYNEEVLGELFFNSTLCVSPGNVGLTAIHSLTYGTPVLTHSDFRFQGPEFEAIQPGFSGLFFEKDDVEDLAEKIHLWISRPISRDVLRKNCFSIVEKQYNPKYQLEVIKKAIGL